MVSVSVCGQGCVFDVQIQMQVPQLSDKLWDKTIKQKYFNLNSKQL